MKNLSFLIKPASSMCNLACHYCFYYDVSNHREEKSYGFMEEGVMEQLIDRAFEAIDADGVLTFAFQGGEPLLAGIKYFQKFTRYVEYKRTNQQVHYSLQTNGTLLDEEWGRFFLNFNFLIGLSLDGYEGNTNKFRVDKQGKGVYSQIKRGLYILKKYKITYNVLSVITKKLSGHGEGFYSFLKREGITHVQCIPCLGGLEAPYEQEMKAEDYLRFYKDLYRIWLQDFNRGEYISISLFDQIFLMLSDSPPIQCGMLGFCSPQMVVEANGNVYPCDFYVLDQYCCGNVCENSIEEIIENEHMKTFLSERAKMTPVCEDCPFIGICHGGCKRQNRTYLKKDWCAHREFLFWAYPSMSKILS